MRFRPRYHLIVGVGCPITRQSNLAISPSPPSMSLSSCVNLGGTTSPGIGVDPVSLSSLKATQRAENFVNIRRRRHSSSSSLFYTPVVKIPTVKNKMLLGYYYFYTPGSKDPQNPGFKRGPGCPRINWSGTVNKDLLRMGITWEEAEMAAHNRSEWHWSVAQAQCIHLDAG